MKRFQVIFKRKNRVSGIVITLCKTFGLYADQFINFPKANFD